jgi:hypothetical protein
MLSAPPHFFLFNCPAGSSRYSSDQRLRITRCNRIYISRLTEDCLGGLPGMLFCIQEARSSASGVALIGDGTSRKRRIASCDARFQVQLG